MRWLQSDHLLPLVPAMLRHVRSKGNEAGQAYGEPDTIARSRIAIFGEAPSSSCLK